MIKLIALDLDGTLLNPRGQITQGAKEAIAKARAAGVRVVLNTGRPVPEAIYFSREAGCDDLVSCLGGAAIAHTGTEKVLHRWDIPHDSGLEALALCLNREIELMIFAGPEILLDPFSKASLERTYPFPVFHKSVVVVDDPLAYMKEQGLPLTKLHGDWNPDNYPLAELAELEGVELTRSNDRDFELIPKDMDKGHALAELARRYGISLADCAAVGDSDNDLGMLRVVGHPIAMGNAKDSIKAMACRVVGDNAHDGVAEAILSCLEL